MSKQIVYIPCKSGNNAFSECAVFYNPGSLLWLMGAGPGSVRMEFTPKDALRLAKTIFDLLEVVPDIPNEHVSDSVSEKCSISESSTPSESVSVDVKYPTVSFCPYCGSCEIENKTDLFACVECKAVFSVTFSQFFEVEKVTP